MGECLVNHSVNDILVQGAEPLYFLDYFSCGKLDVERAASVVGGIAYVMGGYHVLAGSPWELSSDRVHRLDLAAETWATSEDEVD